MFGDLDDPDSEVSKALAATTTEALHPEYDLAEKVRYVGLPKSFVAGAVVLGDSDACAVGASVTLTGDGSTATTLTDGFGDFEFEGLPANTTYTVTTVAVPGYASRELRRSGPPPPSISATSCSARSRKERSERHDER